MDLADLLASHITPERLARIEAVLAMRTQWMTIVLEDIYQGHNAAAVLRTCECYGLQTVHCIETRNKFRPSDEIAMGAQKWLTLQRHTSTLEALQTLKTQGIQIVAMTLQPGSIPLDQVPLERPTALVYGTEEQGLGPEAHQMADVHAHLPMVGFTQSYNISVSVAISLQTLMPRLRQRESWQLTQGEREAIRLEWLKKCVPHWQLIAQRAGIAEG